MCLVVLSLRCCRGFSVVAESGGYSLVVVGRLFVTVASLVELRLQGTGSVAVVHGLSCSAASGIFLDQGGNRDSCVGRWILYHRATREA